MNAFEFVKEKGIGEAKAFLDLPEYTIDQLMMLQAGLCCADLKRIVDSHEIVSKLGGVDRAKRNLISTDRRLGYTHVYLHGNGFYCFLDDYVDYIIPERAIDIKSAIQAIRDVEACS
ncbi:hypothetical protein [Acinetobacter pullicarnis]|uniref:hypothetical protein n=1 Tax=Acinetobacter pullicarnis TaxID=2576829 RepID=UPI0011248921|nr:hypothetical protein [Acinetobacter pullicarnis]